MWFSAIAFFERYLVHQVRVSFDFAGVYADLSYSRRNYPVRARSGRP